MSEKKCNCIEWDSVRMIGRVKERFKELEEKQWDWRSFYGGWMEGRADMLQQMGGTAAGREEDAVLFGETTKGEVI